MSADEFKNKIETFLLQNVTSKIKEADVLQEIENEYNNIMDLCNIKI
jgi:hypothetical protein